MSAEQNPQGMIDMHRKWMTTPAISAFSDYLHELYPNSTPMQVHDHALHFSMSHMMAYLVGAITDTDNDEDKDKPSWL